MDATDCRAYTFSVSTGGRVVRGEFRGQTVWRRAWRGVTRVPSMRFYPRSWEGRIVAVVWALAAVATLGVAYAQSVQMFLLSFAAVTFGTYTTLWLMNGLPSKQR
jgi:hypothetical protein